MSSDAWTDTILGRQCPLHTRMRCLAGEESIMVEFGVAVVQEDTVGPTRFRALTERWSAGEILRALLLCEESGSWRAAVRILSREGVALDAVDDMKIKSALDAFKNRLDEALAYEQKHGVDSLRLADHPANIAVDKRYAKLVEAKMRSVGAAQT